MLLVLSTFSSLDEARAVGRLLVEESLAACVNIVPGVESIYRWKGEVQTAGEVLVILKTTRMLYPALEKRLLELHSYEVPEILAIEPTEGLPAYLACVAEATDVKAE